MLELIMIFNIFLFSLTFSEDIPNTLILDNPKKPVSTIKTIKKKEKAELNLNIKKISSFNLNGYINRDKKLISFVLDELVLEDNFYLTDTKEIFDERTKKVKDYSNIYELEKTDYLNKAVTFKYNNLPKELYLVKYDSKTKELKKLYKWQEEYTEYIDTQRGNLKFTFTEDYKPFEIISFSLNKIANTKGVLEIKNGSYLKIDPILSKEVIIKNDKGENLGTITLKNGNGFFKLDESKKGLILERGSSILNFGIGFKNNEILLQIKGTTDSTKEYPLSFEVVNLDGTIQNYSANIKPAQYAFKILTNSLNLDFNNSKEALNEAEIDELISKSEILIDSKDLNLEVQFINNGVIKLKNGENILNGKIEAQLENSLSQEKIKTIKVIGKVNKKDIKNMPDGDYIGSTELIIIVDSWTNTN